LITDYPKDKIEWIVVEDSDVTEEQASDKIMKWARQCMEEKTLSVTYIPLPTSVSIGEKRNIACERAQHDIILMMDDDDHYPSSSFRRRVAWLTKHPFTPQAAVATTIACYDLLQGTSAVNTPPFTLGLKERVSEATLTFYKSFWEEKPFPTVNMSEGEGFLDQREDKVLELQPQQIIVAMSHGKNASSRRIPPGPSGKPSCFWGFPPEFLKFLHGLAGVEVTTS
jgi:glycosyltransferase involved in cell wall biosynthesis